MKIQGLIIVFIGIISLCCARPNEFVQFACQYFSGMFQGECLKVDGAWGTWGPFTLCTETCGGGIRNRTRACNDPPAANGGAECPNIDTDNIESETCNIAPCPVDGVWGSWGPFTQCTAACGGGFRNRTRECNNPPAANGGAECPNSDTEIEPCNTAPCPIDGMWGGWTLFTECSATCDGGTRVRTRMCNNPSPAFNGAPCSTLSLGDTETERCATNECPETKCKRNNFVYDSDTSICIQLYTEKKTFADAQTACVNDGGFLFKMDLTVKMNIAYAIIKDRKSDQDSFWIGAKNVGSGNELDFEWLDGSRVTWIGPGPTNPNNDCVRLRSNNPKNMDDTSCTTNQFYFFCEIIV